MSKSRGNSKNITNIHKDEQKKWQSCIYNKTPFVDTSTSNYLTPSLSSFLPRTNSVTIGMEQHFICRYIPATCCHWIIHTCYLLSLDDTYLMPAVKGWYIPATCCYWIINTCYLLSLDDTYLIPAIIGRYIPDTCCHWMIHTYYQTCKMLVFVWDPCLLGGIGKKGILDPRIPRFCRSVTALATPDLFQSKPTQISRNVTF